MPEQWEMKQDPDDLVDGSWEVGYTNSRGLYVLLGYGLTKKAARLIAAAPDLLAAILNSDDAHWTPAMRAAVRKATEPRP